MEIGDHRRLCKTQAPNYQRLVSIIIDYNGSLKAGLRAAGISDHAYRRLMNERHICAGVARKILTAYHDLKSSEAIQRAV